jgi:hypothetical protein
MNIIKYVFISQLVIENISRDILNMQDLSENQNTGCKNLWDVGKAALIEKSLAMNPYTKNSE